jgi:hypothetical protein
MIPDVVASPKELAAAEAMSDRVCRNLAMIIQNVPGYRQALQSADIVALAGENSAMSELGDALAAVDGPVAAMALPIAIELRDICYLEGLRRGAVLHRGEDYDAKLAAAFITHRLLGVTHRGDQDAPHP